MVSSSSLILLLGIFQSLYFLNSFVVTKKTESKNNYLALSRKFLAFIVFSLAFGEIYYLIQIFLKKDTRFVLVNLLVTDDLNNEYRLFASWSNTAGSLLLWFTFLTAVQIILEFSFEDLQTQNKVINLVSGFTLLNIIGLIFENPFLQENKPSHYYGLAPSLQSPYIGIHPVLSFLAYALSIIPFAIYASKTTVTDEILKKVEKVSIITSFLLGSMIITGAIWSYEVLWGGHWTWDLIENLSLLIFLCSVLPYHLKKYNKDVQLLSHAFTFPAVLFSTFAIRSGLIQSTHAYAFSASAVFFLLLFLSSLLPFRRIKLKSDFTLDFSLRDFGGSIWIISLITIIFILLFSTITIGFYAFITNKVLDPPILFLNFGILTLLIIPLLITLTLELRNYFGLSFRLIRLLWFIVSLAFIIIIYFPIQYSHEVSSSGIYFAVLPLIIIFLSSTMENPTNNMKRNFRHTIKITVHMLFLLFIFSLLLTYYSQATKKTIIMENTEKNIFGKKIEMIDYSFSSSVIETNKPVNLPIQVDWDLKVSLLIDGKEVKLNSGWNEQHQFYSIPYQITSWYQFYQISLDFLDGKTFYININSENNNTEFMVYIKVRVSFGGKLVRSIQFLFNFSLILPILRNRYQKQVINDFYN